MSEGLTKRTVGSFIWASVGTVGQGFINFVVLMVLARILTPDDFGLLEMLVVFTSVSLVLIDSGFSQALIKDKDATNLDYSTIFYFNTLISISIYLFLSLLSPFVGEYFNEPRFAKYAYVGFLAIIFDSFGVIQNTIYSKTLNFKPIAVANIIAIVISGTTAIAMAYYGYGVWALICNIVLLSLVRTVVLWLLSEWRPSFVFSINSIKKYFTFSVFLLLRGLFDKLVINLEALMIGRYYTKSDLGLYSQSRKLDAYFIQTLTNVVVKVTYPSLAKIADTTDRLRDAYRRILKIVTFLIFPIVFCMIFLSADIIWVIFGDKWLDAAPYLTLWAVWGFFFPIQSITTNIFLTQNKSNIFFYLTMLKHSLKILVVIVSVYYHIEIYYMLLWIIITTIFSTILLIYFSGRLIEYSISLVVKDLFLNLLISFTSVFIVSNLFKYIIIDNVFMKLFAEMLFIGILYFMFNIIFKNSSLTIVKNIVKSFLNKKVNA